MNNPRTQRVQTPSPTPTVPQTKPLYHTSPDQIADFYHDMAVEHAALESLNIDLKQGAEVRLGEVVCMSSDRQQETTYILKKNGVYHVYFNFSELWSGWWETNLVSFTQWIMSLTESDRVEFYQTGKIIYLPMATQILNVLAELCKAHKVFVVDHIIDTPLFMLACNEVLVEDTGAIVFDRAICLDNGSKNEKMLMPWLRKMLMKAVGWAMLTEEEVNQIINNDAIVFKTARQLHNKDAT